MKLNLKLTIAIIVLSGFWGARLGAQEQKVVQPEIVSLSLQIGGVSTEVVTHIYKPDVEGNTTFPVVVFAHGNKIPPTDLHTQSRSRWPIGGVKEGLRSLLPCGRATAQPAAPSAKPKMSPGKGAPAQASLHINPPL